VDGRLSHALYDDASGAIVTRRDLTVPVPSNEADGSAAKKISFSFTDDPKCVIHLNSVL